MPEEGTFTIYHVEDWITGLSRQEEKQAHNNTYISYILASNTQKKYFLD